jgi:hypothetical protein
MEKKETINVTLATLAAVFALEVATKNAQNAKSIRLPTRPTISLSERQFARMFVLTVNMLIVQTSSVIHATRTV